MMTEQAESFAQNDDDDVGCIFFSNCFNFFLLIIEFFEKFFRI